MSSETADADTADSDETAEERTDNTRQNANRTARTTTTQTLRAAAPAIPAPAAPAAQITIEDEEVPLAVEQDDEEETDSLLDNDTIRIEDEAVPLAGDGDGDDCDIHEKIALATGVYAIYSVARGVARHKKIKDLEDETEQDEKKEEN